MKLLTFPPLVNEVNNLSATPLLMTPAITGPADSKKLSNPPDLFSS